MRNHKANQLDYQSDGSPRSREAREGAVADLVNEALARLCAQASVSGKLPRQPRAPGERPRAGDVVGDPLAAALAFALCDEDPDSAQAIVGDLLDAGVAVPELCLDHLAPAARLLGEWWDEDRVPFTDVTLATARIQSMLLRLPAGGTRHPLNDAGSAVFASVPGEQHTLGVVMAADLFRRNGWDVGLIVGAEHEELIDRLSRDDRPVIGLSCGGDHSVAALKRLMAAIRRSRPEAQLVISGQITADPARLKDLQMPFTVIRSAAEAERVMADLARGLRAASRVPRDTRQSG